MRGHPYRHGTTVVLADGTEWESCAVWPDSDQESLGTDGARSGAWKVVAQYGAAASKGDVLTFNGRGWVIGEDPEPYRSPFTGWAAGTVLTVYPVPALAELEGHRRLALASMLDTIVIERPTPAGFDYATGRSRVTFTEVYSGAADVAAATYGTVAVEGAETTTIGTRTVTTPAEVLAVEGDRVTVTACPGAPSLVGAMWWVTSTAYESSPDRTRIDVREMP